MLARFQYAGVLATLVLLRGLALAQPGQTNSADAWQSMYESGRFQEAITALNKVLEHAPTNLVALYHLGCCHYKLGDFEQAVAPLEKYVAAMPKDFYGSYYLGQSHFELRQFDRAARALQAAHEIKPDDGFTRFGLFASCMATAQYEQAYRLYPFMYGAGVGVLLFGYAIGLAWLLVRSFQTRPILAPPILTSFPEHGSPEPEQPGDCRTSPPALPGELPPAIVTGACGPTSSGVGRSVLTAPRASEDARAMPVLAASHGAAGTRRTTFKPANDLGDAPSAADRANARPGMCFFLGWLAAFVAGQLAWAFLIGFLQPFQGAAAALAGMGAASLPLVVAAGAGFTRQPWGAPFGWPRSFPPAKLLVLSVLGLVSVQLFEAGYSGLVEWITHKPFPVQAALPFIREAMQTNPISVIISIIFFAPMAEEVLFRGLLFGALQKWLSARWTIILTAAMFALIHMQVIYFFPIFLVGLLCGWARYKSGSLAVPMLLHVLNNGMSFLLMQLFPEAT